MMTKIRIALLLTITLGMFSSRALAARTYNGLTTEYVDIYINSDDLDNGPQVGGYQYNMTNSITGSGNFALASGQQFSDGNVYKSDFLDPNDPAIGPCCGADTNNFDEPSSSVSFYAGHGNCADDPLDQQPAHRQTCTVSSTCTNPAGYTDSIKLTNPGRCVWSPVSSTGGYCEYSPLNGKLIYGSSPNTGGDWTLSLLTQGIHFGEDPINTFTNSYGGNGGMNVLQLYNSCSMRMSNLGGQLSFGVFNGLILMQVLVPTVPEQSGEWNDVESSNLPSLVGSQHFYSPNGNVVMAWEAAFSGSSGGQPCAYGGGHQGISGCGAALTIAEANTTPLANSNLTNTTWATVRTDLYKPTGQASQAAVWTCNYDCSATGHPVTR